MDIPINKKVLILGNGFDLAHGLLTRYSNFLDFCHAIMNPKKSYIDDIVSEWISDYNVNLITSTDFCIQNLDYFIRCLICNIWYIYLNELYCEKAVKGENWIDFESEISFIIQTLDVYAENMTLQYAKALAKMDNNVRFESKFSIFNKIFNKNHVDSESLTIKEVRKILYDDLERLIVALEAYLSFIDNALQINFKLSDIDDYYDYIINFNYTHTYQKLYNENIVPFYIHGELGKEPNNMVLGIDEYWSEEERNSHTNFTIFKKFAQRIQNRTGIESYKWIDQIKNYYKKNKKSIASVYIFGHSLDVTDKDILFDYLNDDATDVTIFCRDKETEGEYIANVIKIIGEKRLLEKVNQNPPKLKFVLQQGRTPIEKKDLSASGVVT